MRKFVAMLRDSLKEAVDGWIFLVMLILAGVVIALVASISFTPLPVEEAVPKLVPPATGRGPNGAGPLQIVSSDRGTGPKLYLFPYATAVTDVTAGPAAGDPWATPFAFDLRFTSAGFGGGVEVTDPNAPKVDAKNVGGLFADPFKEAVRTWASAAGGEKPEYSDALAREFVAGQLRSIARIDVTAVDAVGPGRFRVSAAGADGPLAWPHTPGLLFGAWNMRFLQQPLGQLVHLVENTLVNGLGAWVVLLAGVVVTAGFIPNMLRKGAIDLLLTKPMARPTILIYKYLGGLLFVLLLATVAFGGVWLAVGVRTGVWAPGLLYCIGGVTFYFAILYAVSTLFGVLTRNAIVSIVVTVVFWFVVWLIGTIHGSLTVFDNIEDQRRVLSKQVAGKDKPAEKKKAEKPAAGDEDDGDGPADAGPGKPPRALVKTFEVLNRVAPRTTDLDNLTSGLISKGLLSEGEQRQAGLRLRSLDWGEVLGVAGAYIALFLGLATLRFVTRSY